MDNIPLLTFDAKFSVASRSARGFDHHRPVARQYGKS